MGDRPLSRTAIRLAFRLLAGRARAHGQDVWPHLKLSKPRPGGAPVPILWKGREAGQLRPYAELFPWLRGQSILLVAAGPSAAQLELANWRGPALLVNGALHHAAQARGPAIGLVEDERFVWRHFSLMQEAADQVDHWCLSPAALRVALAQDAGWAVRRSIFLIDDMAKPVGQPRQPDVPLLSSDPDRGVVPAGTIAFSAAQIALAAAPRELLFAGVDLTNADAPRFYETQEDMAASGISRALDRIERHFAALIAQAECEGVLLGCLSRTSALLSLGVPYRETLTPEAAEDIDPA